MNVFMSVIITLVMVTKCWCSDRAADNTQRGCDWWCWLPWREECNSETCEGMFSLSLCYYSPSTWSINSGKKCLFVYNCVWFSSFRTPEPKSSVCMAFILKWDSIRGKITTSIIADIVRECAAHLDIALAVEMDKSNGHWGCLHSPWKCAKPKYPNKNWW